MKSATGIIVISLLLSTCVQAQLNGAQEPDPDRTRWSDVQSIIDEIKTQNPPDDIKIKIKTGITQILTNSLDGVTLGLGGALPTVGIEGTYAFWGNLGIEAREIYGQNISPDPSSVNTSQGYMSWSDFGLRYSFYLDSTRLDNNTAVKVLRHENYNNLSLNPGKRNVLWANYYSGYALGIERNIPITNKLGLCGSFNLQLITATSSPSVNATDPTLPTISQSGYGFEVQAEVYYKFLLSKLPLRAGLTYWQQGNQTDIDTSLRQSLGKSSYFQSSRALFATMTLLF